MTISPNASTVWRNYTTDGIPSSGTHKVNKADVRTWGSAVETVIDAYSSGAGSIAKATRALLYADLAHDADVMAWVYADSTVAYNGIYRKLGASGSGSWSRILDLPYDVIIATDAGAGTANAIVATTSLPVSESALILLNVYEANTGTPVTVAFNGGSALTIETAAGNNVASGGLVAGMALLGRISGSTFRMISDQASAAIQAAAEAAQVAAEAAAAAAAESAAEAATQTLNFANVADLTADATLTYTPAQPGTVVAGYIAFVRQEGTSYEVAASGASDQHVTTAGGVKLYEAGPRFSSVATLSDALGRGVDDGTEMFVGDVRYVADSTATGSKSALSNYGVDGVISPRFPGENFYLATFFQSNEEAQVYFYTSNDALHLSKLNWGAARREAGAVVGGRDPSIIYYQGWWLAGVTWYVADSYDFAIYRSKTLIGPWERVHCTAGTVPVVSATNFAPDGGTVANELCWWGGLYIIGDDLYASLSLQFGPDFVDINTNTVKDKRPYLSKLLDIDTLAFDTPFRVDFADSVSRIDSKLYVIGGEIKLLTKNEYNKDIEIWSAATVDATFTLDNTVTFSSDVEGPSLVTDYYFSGNDGSQTKAVQYHLLADSYTDGRYLRKTSADLVTWGTQEQVISTNAIRHGNIVNLYDLPESANAIADAFASMSAMGWNQGANYELVRLDVGANTLTPQDDTVYWVGGSDVCSLTIDAPSAKRFWVGVFTDTNTAGLTINDGSYFTARDGVGEYVGFGDSKLQFFEIRLNGTLYQAPSGLPRRKNRFSAHKNGTAQTGIASATATKITFGTEDEDVGSVWDTSSSRLIVPNGRSMIFHAVVAISAGIVDQTQLQLMIYKNGAAWKQALTQASGTGSQSVSVSALIEGNGSDYYEVYLQAAGAGDKTVLGGSLSTWVEGWSY